MTQSRGAHVVVITGVSGGRWPGCTGRGARAWASSPAAATVEAALGPIDVWINNAMARCSRRSGP